MAAGKRAAAYLHDAERRNQYRFGMILEHRGNAAGAIMEYEAATRSMRSSRMPGKELKGCSRGECARRAPEGPLRLTLPRVRRPGRDLFGLSMPCDTRYVVTVRHAAQARPSLQR